MKFFSFMLGQIELTTHLYSEITVSEVAIRRDYIFFEETDVTESNAGMPFRYRFKAPVEMK